MGDLGFGLCPAISNNYYYVNCVLLYFNALDYYEGGKFVLTLRTEYLKKVDNNISFQYYKL